ncbi:hypothetical protein EW145_g4395 [Phellinidium pouzarii]|uniref:BTB domain-containing protein n=1 Tax=Phellinidium pouzarii TaxID=167371 RepID=A0A4S4L450_9AGAM|nr:hypothetical protein EW145_g4395 [Phellinidium pouzarii]
MILRSSDGVDFRVMKAVLAASSPVFQDMTTLAKPLTSENKDKSSEVLAEWLSIVVMYASNLDKLLCILYPFVSPKVQDLEILSGLLCAGQKYDMDAIIDHVRAELRDCINRTMVALLWRYMHLLGSIDWKMKHA